MLIKVHFYLLQAKAGVKRLPSMHVCVHVFNCHMFISSFISHSFIKISKFAENVYSCENMSAKK